jgi:hypothetical protein
MQLGLSKREVCDQAEIPMTVLTKLELNGEIDELTVRVIERTLAVLHLTLFEAHETPNPVKPSNERHTKSAVQAIGSLLYDRRAALNIAAIAATLNLSIETVEAAIENLAKSLPANGLTITIHSTGIRISALQPTAKIDTRMRYLTNLNLGDMKLLYRIANQTNQQPVWKNSLWQSETKRMSAQKLHGAGLINIDQPIIQLSLSTHTNIHPQHGHKT